MRNGKNMIERKATPTKFCIGYCTFYQQVAPTEL